MLSSAIVANSRVPYEVLASHARTQSHPPLLKRTIKKDTFSIPEAGIGSLGLDKDSLVGAIKKGFRLIDTAKAYKNEKSIAEAILESGVPAADIFVVTKLFNPNVESREALRNAIKDSELQLGKVPDLFLIHGPYPEAPMLSLFDELESMKAKGKIQEYGVSNFDLDQLEFLVRNGIKPALNQVEYHPYFQRPELLKFCQENDIILQAYRPLAEGSVLRNHTIDSIAQEHGVKPATIVYTWLAQQGIPIVTKVSSEAHQNEYAQSGQVELSSQQMHAIANLNQGENGRTCKKGGWLVPFTPEVEKQWATEDLTSKL